MRIHSIMPLLHSLLRPHIPQLSSQCCRSCCLRAGSIIDLQWWRIVGREDWCKLDQGPHAGLKGPAACCIEAVLPRRQHIHHPVCLYLGTAARKQKMHQKLSLFLSFQHIYPVSLHLGTAAHSSVQQKTKVQKKHSRSLVYHKKNAEAAKGTTAGAMSRAKGSFCGVCVNTHICEANDSTTLQSGPMGQGSCMCMCMI